MKKTNEKKDNIGDRQTKMLLLIVVLFMFLVITGVFMSNKLLKATYSAPTSCYSCQKSIGNGNYDTVFTKAESQEEAATLTGGTDCHLADMNFCNLQCYGCSLGVGTEYTLQLTADAAATATTGTNCQVVEYSTCNNLPTQCYKCMDGATPQYVLSTDHCAACGQDSTNFTIVAASNCASTNPTIGCYSCNLGAGKEYTYAMDASEAASTTGGTNCTRETNIETCDEPPQVCYSCNVGGTNKYAYANNKVSAASATGGSNCTIVSDTTNCEPTRCYSCDLGEGKEYAYAKTASAAATSTGGTNCTVMTNTANCDNPPIRCYACTKGSETKYTKAATRSAAATNTGCTTCTVANESNCVTSVEKCYECNFYTPKTNGKYYIVSDQDLTSSPGLDNTTCTVVNESSCTASRCYMCGDTTNDDTANVHVTATTRDAAINKSGKKWCFVADGSKCQQTPKENPKTGTAGIIIAWAVGVMALLYTCFYVMKLNKLK